MNGHPTPTIQGGHMGVSLRLTFAEAEALAWALNQIARFTAPGREVCTVPAAHRDDLQAALARACGQLLEELEWARADEAPSPPCPARRTT